LNIRVRAISDNSNDVLARKGLEFEQRQEVADFLLSGPCWQFWQWPLIDEEVV
jgi:hypothetical protein